ncbi:uncharacterized protein Z519_12706 [Cladophialophora bantiana CBS 173.52]|uniref:Uncharacterized protein n=1 Tax=Cladophialophora bantiana (strain ATCC 10958 / CBS 173.52 / CDC B-1940 / NIH 8579) TaxID=1442370 RepID=A0A0D2H765_CLAB1|nr:uncharacterized protein Z519_12706 [Cladophialophora bantiana CBS 173.52]KIW86720.1 hypothetical protein Z519_12706 [Cladophialophora bantiana CBS 173.52]
MAGLKITLDNCVSIESEMPDANWIIERMPSKRVISCLVALSDVTYIILKFSHVTDLNHNAVPYHPDKPPDNRIAVMANTTVNQGNTGA